MAAPKLGIASHSIPGVEKLTPSEVLASVKALGLDGCVFMNPLQISPTLDTGALRDVRACADDLGIFLEIGLGRINPLHFGERADVAALADGDVGRGLVRMIEALAAIGCTEQFFWIGSPADRVSSTLPWNEQVRVSRDFLLATAPLLRDTGCHLNFKTHGENPTAEVVETVEIIGPDVLGVAFDPANLCESLEDPRVATERVAPYVRQLQADDLLLAFDAHGLVRQLRPCGAGVLDWPAILSVLRDRAPSFTVTVELHRAEARMPIFDPAWLAFQTEVTVLELAEMIRLARRSEQLLASGETPPLSVFSDRDARREPSTAYLRDTLAAIYA